MKTAWSSFFLTVLIFGFLIGVSSANLSGKIIDTSGSDNTNNKVSGPLQFSTLTGIDGSDEVIDVGLDGAGDIYVLGAVTDANALDPRNCYLLKVNGTDYTLIYDIVFGGSDWDTAMDMFVDPLGRVYVTGSTNSPDFPVKNAIFDEYQNNTDCFIICFDVDPDTVLFSTYLGGYWVDVGESIFVDAEGSIFVTGRTRSGNFPLVNSFSNHSGGSDIFVLKLNSTGTGLLYSSLIGEESPETGKAITVDSVGNAYVAGTTKSENFPLLYPVDTDVGPLGTSGNEAVVFCLNATGNGLIFSTFFGGSSTDIPYDIELDSQGNVWVCGETASTDFPLKDEFQMSSRVTDCFLFELSSDGSVLLFSTTLGGIELDACYSMCFDEIDNLYLAGNTNSHDFPLVRPEKSIYQYDYEYREPDAFVMKISPQKSILYSTPVGGRSSDWALSIAIGENGAAIVGGCTYSDEFPQRRELSDASYDIATNSDGFVFVLLDISDEDGDRFPSWWETQNGFDPL
ncbi:MAG: SBBP repeat-containing protein, partial [Candidatus Thorarchaeota archaeon]